MGETMGFQRCIYTTPQANIWFAQLFRIMSARRYLSGDVPLSHAAGAEHALFEKPHKRKERLRCRRRSWSQCIGQWPTKKCNGSDLRCGPGARARAAAPGAGAGCVG